MPLPTPPDLVHRAVRAVNLRGDAPLIALGEGGLLCPRGGFAIDPWRPADVAVLTHAHSDHTRAGSRLYYCALASLDLCRQRLPPGAEVRGVPYGEPFRLGETTVSLHPAGHILGSAQVRVEADGEVWVFSGDYKRDPDPTCAPFEVVPCDVFITESTFALPVYRWRPGPAIAADIYAWWQENARLGRASVLLCYAVGKAQRALAELAAYTDQPVWLHGAVEAMMPAYRKAGVPMLPTQPVGGAPVGQSWAGSLVVAPPSAEASPWIKRFGECETAFASGWMRVRGNRRRRGSDRGFVLSDHADWPGLLDTVHATGASRILATHGFGDTLARHLRDLGLDAQPLATRRPEPESVEQAASADPHAEAGA